MLKDPKRTIIDPPPAQHEAWAAKFRPLHDQWIADHPKGGQRHQRLNALLAEYRAKAR